MIIVKCNEKRNQTSNFKRNTTVIYLIRNFNVRYSKNCKTDIKTLAS